MTKDFSADGAPSISGLGPIQITDEVMTVASIEADLLDDAGVRNAVDTLAFHEGQDDWPDADEAYWGSPERHMWEQVETDPENGIDLYLQYRIGSWTVGSIFQIGGAVTAEVHWNYAHGVGDYSLENAEGEPLTVLDAMHLVVQASKLMDLE